MNFNYVAYNLEQGIVKGKLEAQNEYEVQEEISQRGYKLLHAKVIRQMPGVEDLFPSLFKITNKELVQFAQQLSIMVRGGLCTCHPCAGR